MCGLEIDVIFNAHIRIYYINNKDGGCEIEGGGKSWLITDIKFNFQINIIIFIATFFTQK